MTKIALVLISALFFSAVVATDGISEGWKRDIGDNISDLVVTDGKVFTLSFHGNLYCLDQNDGQTLWNYNLEGYVTYGWGPLLMVADGKVFAGARGSRVACFNESTGALLWQFQPSYFTSSFAMKAPPTFTVADGKVFTTGDGFYSVNATNGELIWGYEDYKSDLSLREFEWVIADGRVFIAGHEDVWYLYGLNADNGEVLWTYKIFKWLNSPPIVADGRVLVWDRSENQTMLCLNETSGSLLWSYDVGAQAFQPTISDGLVLFGASDGNFYALNESDSTLKWKYETGYQNPKGYFDFAVARTGFDQVFIGYGVSSQPQNEIEYQGYVCSLNSVNGQSNWATPISNNKASPSSFISIILTLVNRTLYVTTFNDLYSIDADSGKVQWVRNFTYWVLPPIYAYEKLFVAADLKVIAYGETEPLPTTWIVAAIAIIAVVGAALLVYFRKIKKTPVKVKKIMPEEVT